MREIKLTLGKVTVVDDGDYGSLSQWAWSALRQQRKDGSYVWYAVRTDWNASDQLTIRMHRLILAAPVGVDVDHWDGDGLHNWRENLRLATRRQNLQNLRRLMPGKTSTLKGVCWEVQTEKWRATIRGGTEREGRARQISLGRFDTEADAARAYDTAARLYFGEFAAVNFPEEHKR